MAESHDEWDIPAKVIGKVKGKFYPVEWIKCSDRLPPINYYCILYAPNYSEHTSDGPKIFVGFRGNYGAENEWGSAWGDNWVPFDFEEITHWMPLPEDPKD